MTKFKDYFCGNKISEYGKENGFVDYATFAKAFDAVLANGIIPATGWENWEQLQGFAEEDEDEDEIFQYFIVDTNGANLIEEYTNDPLFYNENLDLYVWGVTHWGTGWDYVLTDIPCEKA